MIGATAAFALFAASPGPAAQAASTEPTSAAVFAILDRNEWCPGGGVFLELQTGAFTLYRRGERPECSSLHAPVPIERGVLDSTALQRLRSVFLTARRAGLKRAGCEPIVSNGGPHGLVIVGSGFSAAAPEEEGCWSQEASALFDELFEVFGNEPGR